MNNDLLEGTIYAAIVLLVGLLAWWLGRKEGEGKGFLEAVEEINEYHLQHKVLTIEEARMIMEEIEDIKKVLCTHGAKIHTLLCNISQKSYEH